MKTIRDFYNSLQKTDENSCWVNPETIASEVGVIFYLQDDIPGLTAWFAYKWLCTDSMVGLRFYFLGDECVAASMQNGRKCDEQFEWVSVEARDKVRSLVMEQINNHLNKEAPALVNWEQIIVD